MLSYKGTEVKPVAHFKEIKALLAIVKEYTELDDCFAFVNGYFWHISITDFDLYKELSKNGVLKQMRQSVEAPLIFCYLQNKGEDLMRKRFSSQKKICLFK
jgi:hypothetical protein